MNNKSQKKVWHEGHIRKRKQDGRIEGIITIDGIRKSVYGKSEAEVKRKIKEFKQQVLAKQINPKTDLLYEYSSKWLFQNKFGKVEPSYYDRLESIVNYQIGTSKLSKKQVGKITTDELQGLLDELANPKKDGRAYSHSTIKKVYDFLSMIYRDAYNKKILVRNPMRDVTVPKQSNCMVMSKEPFSLSDDEIQRLKNSCLVKTKSGHYKYRNALFLLLILNTGLRVGESISLTFDDINWTDGYIIINKALQSNVKTRNGEAKKRTSRIKNPKSKKGVRYIPINAEIEFIITEIINDNKRRGIHPKYVCSTNKGTIASARNFQRTLNIISDNAALPHLWLHLLRHTFGSTLLRKGVDISVVSRLMGHSSIAITYKHYIHVIEEQMVKAMTLISVS